MLLIFSIRKHGIAMVAYPGIVHMIEGCFRRDRTEPYSADPVIATVHLADLQMVAGGSTVPHRVRSLQ